MISRRAWARIHAIYDNVHAALWALLCAFVVWTVVVVVPKLPAAREKFERVRAQEIAVENKFYCEKWGMPVGTHTHTLCTLDLQQLRAKIAKRMADEWNEF